MAVSPLFKDRGNGGIVIAETWHHRTMKKNEGMYVADIPVHMTNLRQRMLDLAENMISTGGLAQPVPMFELYGI